MFTGIVEELGVVRRVVPHTTGCRLEFEATVVQDIATLALTRARQYRPNILWRRI
jgi:riboflavin synthase alpha subunit